VTVLEDEGEDAEGGREAQRGHQYRLDGQDHRTEREEQQDQGRSDHDEDHHRQPVQDGVVAVVDHGLTAADKQHRSVGSGDRTQICHCGAL